MMIYNNSPIKMFFQILCPRKYGDLNGSLMSQLFGEIIDEIVRRTVHFAKCKVYKKNNCIGCKLHRVY